VRDLKALQDSLGEFQDTQVQQDELRAFAAQMMEEARRTRHHPARDGARSPPGWPAGSGRARIEFAGRFP